MEWGRTMTYKIHQLKQGSAPWHSFRSTHFGASEAASALGLSRFKTRDELLKEKVTGVTKEVDARTQAIFDKGHATEESARIFVEMMIDEDLSPVTLSDGDLSC